MHRSGRGSILSYDEVAYEDVISIRCSEKQTYTSCLAAIVQDNLDLIDVTSLLIVFITSHLHALSIKSINYPISNIFSRKNYLSNSPVLEREYA